jgi:putative flippase GtrA
MKEAVKFLFFGGVTTGLNWLVYMGLVQLNVPFQWANVLAWILAVVFAYWVNAKWVFQTDRETNPYTWRGGLNFFWSRLATGIIDWVALPLLVNAGFVYLIFETTGMEARILITGVITLLNFAIGKWIVFRKTE